MRKCEDFHKKLHLRYKRSQKFRPSYFLLPNCQYPKNKPTCPAPSVISYKKVCKKEVFLPLLLPLLLHRHYNWRDKKLALKTDISKVLAHASTQKRTNAQTHAQTHASLHAQTQASMPARTNARMQGMHAHARMHAHNACMLKSGVTKQALQKLTKN